MPKSHIEEYLGDLLEINKVDDRRDSAQAAEQKDLQTVTESTEKALQAAWYLMDIQGLNIGIRSRYIEKIVPATSIQLQESALTMGTYEYEGRMTRVIDLGVLLIPKGKTRKIAPRWLAIIRGRPYAFTCQSHEKIEFNDSDICWRSEKTSRPWLAGTVIAKKCALIDLEAILPLLGGDGVSQ